MRPVYNMTKRSDYNFKQQSNTPPNLGGPAISKIKERRSFAKTNCTKPDANI